MTSRRFTNSEFWILFVFFVFGLLAAPGVCQEMLYPIAVAKSSDGLVYVADRDLPGIWKVDKGVATVYFQGSKKYRTPLNAIRCLAIDSTGTLYAGDSATREIYKFNSQAEPGPLTNGAIGIPMELDFDSQANLFVADLERHTIFQVKPDGVVSEFAQVQAPRGLAIDSLDRVWVLSSVGDSLVRFTPSKSKEVVITGTPFEFPNQLAVDEEFNAYVCDGYAHAIWRIAAGGEPKKISGGEPLVNPVGIIIDGPRLLIADPRAKSIFLLGRDGGEKLLSFFPMK